MSIRLYEEFMKKLKVKPVRRFNENPASSTDLVIAIPLKGGTGVRLILNKLYFSIKWN